ncbi:unnamed protein product, partial [Meganyctiphanes norvegica]
DVSFHLRQLSCKYVNPSIASPDAEFGHIGRRRRVHVVESTVIVRVKDINDNAPIFNNGTIFGEVQENGPIDLSVALVRAWDADDPLEGSNAHLTYSIEKNVVEEETGNAIFKLDAQTGLLQTALCCLDRETTPSYQIQVVASDGGGLKGGGSEEVQVLGGSASEGQRIPPRR